MAGHDPVFSFSTTSGLASVSILVNMLLTIADAEQNLQLESTSNGRSSALALPQRNILLCGTAVLSEKRKSIQLLIGLTSSYSVQNLIECWMLKITTSMQYF
jgi:hypothetical protein